MSMLTRSSVRRLGTNHQDELQSNMEETMLDFQQETMKALWHAFHMLDMSNSGSVHVSQLKVITSTIGSKLGFDKAEATLNQDGVLNMDFQTYFEIVKNELIDKQEHTGADAACLGTRLNSIIKTCWTFCNFERHHHCKSFTTQHCVVLWRLYNFLSETDDKGEPATPVFLHPEEAALLLRGFIDATGQKNKETQVKEFLTEKQDTLLTFTDFLNVFEKDYVTGLSNKNITLGLNHLYDIYILNILMKGKLRKRGFKIKSWKDRWLVLTPTHLKYFVGSDEKVQKGTIEFDSECKLEVPADRPAHKPNRFVIQTSKKPYEMSAFDLKSRNEWVSAVELALSRVGKDPNVQKDAARERCMARAEKRRQAAEDDKRRREEAELLKSRENELDEERRKRLEDEELLRARLSELEEERKRRGEAETRWQEEQALREAEQQRLKDLEEIKRELERLLAEERQAKKDEEIVRNLQSKLLEEEFEKREELERLKQQQEEILRAEREQKAVLESDRKEQERLLAEAQDRLEQLERDKAAAAEKMQEAADKLQKAEKDRHIMEEKVKLWKTPVGLARPIQPHAEPLVTHRGFGAFCDKDFVKKQPSIDETAGESKVPDMNKVPEETGTVVIANEVQEDNETKNQTEKISEVDDNENIQNDQDTLNRQPLGTEGGKEKANVKDDVNEGEDVRNTKREASQANNVSEAGENDECKVVQEEDNIQTEMKALNIKEDSEELKPDSSEGESHQGESVQTTEETNVDNEDTEMKALNLKEDSEEHKSDSSDDESQPGESVQATEETNVDNEDLNHNNEQSDEICPADSKAKPTIEIAEEKKPYGEQNGMVVTDNDTNTSAVTE